MANRKEISCVAVLCDNEDQGCQWTGQLSELEVHPGGHHLCSMQPLIFMTVFMVVSHTPAGAPFTV